MVFICAERSHAASVFYWFMLEFWSRVFWLLFTLFHVPIRKDAKLALLHFLIPGLFSYQQKLATYLFIAAKHTIAMAWKKTALSQ